MPGFGQIGHIFHHVSFFLNCVKIRMNACMHACMYVHGGSVKSKPNCLCHIYLMPNQIILRLSRYLENSTINMTPRYCSVDKKIRVLEPTVTNACEFQQVC